MDKVIALLIAAYPHQDFPVDTINAYKLMLADIDPDLLEGATLHCITTNTKNFIPGIAELRQATVDIQMMNSGMPVGIIAWGEVQRSITSGGHIVGTICKEGESFAFELSGKNGDEYKAIATKWNSHRDKCDLCVDSHDEKIKYSHPAIQRVVDAMGMRYLRESDNHVADRAHFLKAYEQVVTREAKEIVTLPQIKELAKMKSITNISSDNQKEKQDVSSNNNK